MKVRDFRVNYYIVKFWMKYVPRKPYDISKKNVSNLINYQTAEHIKNINFRINYSQDGMNLFAFLEHV